MRTAVVTAVLFLTLALLPALATAAPIAQGEVGANAQGTNASVNAGPTVPGPDYIEPIPDIDHPGRSVRLIADSEGHLLLQGRQDGVQRLVAVNADDGSVAWVLDDIAQDCRPVATDDGRIFAQLVANSDTSGESNFSYDPVEIDAADGTITNRYTSPDTDAEPRIGECFDGLRLGEGDVLIAYQRHDFDVQVVGFDTTTDPMTVAWRHEPADTTNSGGNGRVVLSPDGTQAFFTKRISDTDPSEMAVDRIDVTTGAAEDSQAVPGTIFVDEGLLHTGDVLVAFTAATGGQDDPVRLIGLDPDTLDTLWTL